LVTENTILTDENKDALGRMFSELNVDDKELLAAFNSLLKTYKTSTKNLENLTEEQKQEIVGNFVEDLKKTIPQIKDFSDEQLKQLQGAVYKSMFSTDDATKNATDKQIRDILSQAKDALVDGLNFFNDVAFDNLKSRLDAEKEALKERYEFESGILKSKLDNDIISESQYRAKQEKLRKDQVDAENAIEKKLFDAEKKRDANKAKIDFVEAVASIFINEIKEGKGVLSAAAMQAIGTGIATARFGAEIASISARQFVPKKYESGGLVSGPSHSNGGVPFSVQGRGGYEMEGGEFIVNKRATAMHYDLLNSINSKYAGSNYTPARMFKNGGLVNSLEQRQEELNLLRAIAESSVNTSNNTSKPARAYITNSDIRSNETERTITNRNTRL
jgi:polyhydroxyalkanoate synthesis regulator phasin